jgi:hypothetical protein
MAFGKNAPKYGAQQKSCSLKWQQNYIRNLGQIELHLLCDDAFAHCTNWLMKSTQDILNEAHECFHLSQVHME